MRLKFAGTSNWIYSNFAECNIANTTAVPTIMPLSSAGSRRIIGNHSGGISLRAVFSCPLIHRLVNKLHRRGAAFNAETITIVSTEELRFNWTAVKSRSLSFLMTDRYFGAAGCGSCLTYNRMLDWYYRWWIFTGNIRNHRLRILEISIDVYRRELA